MKYTDANLHKIVTSYSAVYKNISAINKMLSNERLKRLLYYTDKHALNRANLNED